MQPLGVGANVAAAASALPPFDPTLSKGGALFSGFANGLAAQRNAQVQDQTLGFERQKFGLEAMKHQLEIQQMQRQQAGAAAFGQIMNGSGGGGGGAGIGAAPISAPGSGGAPPSMPMPVAGGGAPPPMPAPDPTGGGSPPPMMPPGGGAPSPALTPGQPAPDVSPDSTSGGPVAAPAGPSIPLENQPNAILTRAARIAKAGDAAAASGNTALAQQAYARSAQEQQRATAMMTLGKTMDVNGNEVPLPNHMNVIAQEASAKKAAEISADNAGKPQVTPSGTEYIPTPGAPQPSYAPDPSTPKTIGGTPEQAQIDPQTAKVVSSIPAAPPGGGFPIDASVPAGAKVTKVSGAVQEQHVADKDFEDIVGKTPQLDQAAERYMAAAQALKVVQSGAGGDTRTTWAAYARAAGAPDSIVQGIGNGDPAAAQWLNKEGVGLTLDTLKAAQPRFAQAEFNKVADKGVPSITSDPQANHQLITEGLGSVMRSRQFISDWQTANKSGWASPSAFYNSWSAANPQDKFTRAAQRQIGNLAGQALPPSTDWAQGSVYVAPQSANPKQQAFLQAHGVQPGQAFRYNGAQAQQLLTPVPPSQNFSAHLTGGQ